MESSKTSLIFVLFSTALGEGQHQADPGGPARAAKAGGRGHDGKEEEEGLRPNAVNVR